jgi:hypothetical protein
MYVVAIIGILASIAIPQYQSYTLRARVAEGFLLADPVRKDVAEYYDRWGRLPDDNAAAGLPAPALIAGSQVASVAVKGGAIAVTFGAHVPVDSGVLQLRPALHTAHPGAPLLWICGARPTPAGYQVVGESAHSIKPEYLSAPCRP